MPPHQDSMYIHRLTPNKYSIPVIDEGCRVIVLCGGADASDWLDVHQSAATALEDARGWMSWGKKDRQHRRGQFFAWNTGISHGGEQTRPMVLHHSPPDDEIFSGLLKHPSFIRIAGHASGGQSELHRTSYTNTYFSGQVYFHLSGTYHLYHKP